MVDGRPLCTTLEARFKEGDKQAQTTHTCRMFPLGVLLELFLTFASLCCPPHYFNTCLRFICRAIFSLSSQRAPQQRR